jgi:hypothetical protein
VAVTIPSSPSNAEVEERVHLYVYPTFAFIACLKGEYGLFNFTFLLSNHLHLGTEEYRVESTLLVSGANFETKVYQC